MIIKWTKRLKKKFGWTSSIDLYVVSKECLNRKCFHPHDWNHDGHLVCLTNPVRGRPQEKEASGMEAGCK